MIKPKFYIASKLSNGANARELADYLERQRLECTYRWFDIGEVPEDRYPEIAEKEYEAVERASIFIMLYPAGQGTNTELGAALADRSKRIYVVGPEEYFHKRDDGYYPSAFIYHPRVECRVTSQDIFHIGHLIATEAGL